MNAHRPTLDLCVDAYVPGTRFDPEDLPRIDNVLRASGQELAVAWRRQWQPGQELRIRFLDGDPVVHRRIREHAMTWLRWADLHFVFGDHPTSEIRISFGGEGYWSYVGTDALRIPGDGPTMQFGGFTGDTDETVLRRTVLHEFGHAIGCIHEQASPAAAIPWDVERVYAFYRQWQGWDRDTTFANVLTRYSPEESRFTDHDPLSIMQYPVPAELTVGGFAVGWNNDLSADDCSFIARMYPSGPETTTSESTMTLPVPSALPKHVDASPETVEAVEAFHADVLAAAAASVRDTTSALERSRRLQIVLYVLLFVVGLGAACAATVVGFRADSVGQAIASVGIAGLSAASFFAFFLARPLEALERNAIFAPWLSATVNAYYLRLQYLNDIESVDQDIERATRDLIADLERLASRHAAAISKTPVPASEDSHAT